MRTLGVNGSSSALYLAVAVDGQVVDREPHYISTHSGLPEAQRLPALVQEAAKVIQTLAIDRIRILEPETIYNTSFKSICDRVAMETTVTLGAAQVGVDCDRLSRARVRSLLGIAKKGSLVSHVAGVTPRIGQSWGPRKRDLAALAALAAEKEG